ncbi:hypothetical protein [Halovulum sp. GXIMD14793]
MLLAWLVYIGLRYEELSLGLAAPGETGPFYCRNLLSSGSDDNVMIFVFVIFVVPMSLRVLRVSRSVAFYERMSLWVCIAVTCAVLFIASLDCASIFYTAFVVPDMLLASALIALPLVAVLLSRIASGSQSRLPS